MKLPKYVKEALINSARNHEIARKQQKIFEDWIEAKLGVEAIEDDTIRDTIVDWVEQSNKPNEAIQHLEYTLDDFIK